MPNERPAVRSGLVGVFRVADRSFDIPTRTISLHYAFEAGPEFVETIAFESPFSDDVDTASPSFERALLHLHIAAGTSYYKVAAPAEVLIEGRFSASPRRRSTGISTMTVCASSR